MWVSPPDRKAQRPADRVHERDESKTIVKHFCLLYTSHSVSSYYLGKWGSPEHLAGQPGESKKKHDYLF